MPEPRFGVFLRPDPVMCTAVARITHALRAQFGLVSAAAFPPHATIVGSLATEKPIGMLETAVGTALQGRAPIMLHNAGIRFPNPGIPLDVHTDGQGAVNPALFSLAQDVFDAVLPLGVEGDTRVNPTPRSSFWAHLSLASHDLALRPELYDEVLSFVQGLPLYIPPRSWADTVSLFEFHTDTEWDASWWHSLRWRHLRSWTLDPSGF